MKEKRRVKSNGFTLVELLTTIVVSLIILLGVGIVLANSHRAYQITYDKVNADVSTDSFIARKLFDSVVRKSSASTITTGINGEYVHLQYYDNDYSTYPDRYIRFYVSGNNLMAEYGNVYQGGSQTITDTKTVCSNVSSCVFKNNGASVHMKLTLYDGVESNVIVTTAYAHN